MLIFQCPLAHQKEAYPNEAGGNTKHLLRISLPHRGLHIQQPQSYLLKISPPLRGLHLQHQ